MNTNPLASELLEHMDWARRLAASLLRDDPSAAEDAVQDAWLAATRNPPPDSEAIRPWLATIVRRTIGKTRRSRARRASREESVAKPEASASTADIVARAEAHRDVVNALMELGEPYRATLVLRFFEDMGPSAIAAQQGVPLDTVRSRLRRGLGQLRARLDAKTGDATTTRRALLLLAGPRALPDARPESALMSQAAGPASALRFASSRKLAVAALLLGVAALGYGTFRVLDAGAVPDVPLEVAGAPSDARTEAGSKAAPVGERVSQESAKGSDAPKLGGAADARALLVDVRGAPMSGLTLRWDGPHTVRWQGGDPGWIANDMSARRVRDSLVERLRADAVFAGTWFSSFAFPEEWRATILGARIPDRELLVEEGGLFSLEGALDVTALRFEVADDAHRVLARAVGDAEREVYVASRTARVRGRVFDTNGRGVAAFVTWSLAEEVAALSSMERVLARAEPFELRTSQDGRYALRRVPVDTPVRIQVRTEDGRRASRLLVPSLVASFDLRFAPDLRERVDVRGLVLRPDGMPAGGCRVALGRESQEADAEGRFAFEEVLVGEADALTAWALGYEPARVLRLPDAMRENRVVASSLVLRLGPKTRELRGQVVDARGLGIGAARIALEDPAQLAFSFTPLEARVGGRGRDVECDEEGRFTLAGLSARSYRLRAWTRDGLPLFAGRRVGANAQDVRLVAEALEPRTGIVRDADGRPVAGLALAIEFRTFANASGTGSMSETSELTRSDAQGRFRFERMPRLAGALLMQIEDGVRVRFPIAGLPRTGKLELRYAPKEALRFVQILPHASAEAVGARVLDAKGAVVEVEVHAGHRTMRARELDLREAGTRWFGLPPAAHSLQLIRRSGPGPARPIPADASVLRG